MAEGIEKHVLVEQRKITFGPLATKSDSGAWDTNTWTQCEADEVTVKGKKTADKKRITWYQYCGLLARGDRRSLVLEKMKMKVTSLKRRGKGKGSAASPGPISKPEWLKFATKWLRL